MKRSPSDNKSLRMLALISAIIMFDGALSLTGAAVTQTQLTDQSWLLMAALAMLIASIPSVYMPGTRSGILLSDVVIILCAAIFGPRAAVIAALASGVITSFKSAKGSHTFFYNLASGVVAVNAAGMATTLAFPMFGLDTAHMAFLEVAGAMGLFTLCYFASSACLKAAYTTYAKNDSLFKLLREAFPLTAIRLIISAVAALGAHAVIIEQSYYVFLVVIAVAVSASVLYRVHFQRGESMEQGEELLIATSAGEKKQLPL